jgi:hypothetical protein
MTFLSLSVPVGICLPAQPVPLNACSMKYGAYLTGMKSLLYLFHPGGSIYCIISIPSVQIILASWRLGASKSNQKR